ncbi:hypothetical protein NDN08_006549 [Rhodosorus marinus]|uniref:3-hydroxyisobutyrate dehydrogenase n=1 Tax=Rhodosorus marinus TaxID=101924 RepID=A0AAV8UNA0_9RHOD|nr:hypothetical protein NDN08_006549 [Rhodosorus marinus]
MALLRGSLRLSKSVFGASRFEARSLSNVKDASNVGFVGLGNMGAPMAANLAKFGHRMVVYDRDPFRASEFKKVFNGAVTAETPREVAANCRIVISMLPGPSEVREVCLDPDNGLFVEARSRSVFIDSSTIEPATAKDLSAALVTKNPNALFIDAPVSGGVPGAVNRTLTFMAGCSEETLSPLESLFMCMGKRAISCGDAGSGQVAKVCNNLILGISMTAVSEAMSLAKRLGMEAQPLTDIVNSSSGRCWSSDTYHPVPNVMENVPSSNGYDKGFACDLMLKDLGIAIKEAKRVEAQAPLGLLTAALFKSMSEKGAGKKDFSGIYHYYYQKEDLKKQRPDSEKDTNDLASEESAS